MIHEILIDNEEDWTKYIIVKHSWGDYLAAAAGWVAAR